MAQSVALTTRRRSIQNLFSMIHEMSLGVFDHRQLKEMWDATLWSFVEELRSRGWTAKAVAQVYGMSRDSLYRTRDARPPDKIDLSAMCVIMHSLNEAGDSGLSFEDLDTVLRKHGRRHRQGGASSRLMRTLEMLQSNNTITMKRGRFYGQPGNTLLMSDDSLIEDAFVDIALSAVQDRRNKVPNIVSGYAVMAPADDNLRQEFMRRADEEIEAVLTRLEEWALSQGETKPCHIAVGATGSGRPQ
jgi:hypothetical protein